MLPRALKPVSRVHLVHTSSPVDRADMDAFKKALVTAKRLFPNMRVFDVERSDLDPRYLAASEDDRLAKFRSALRRGDWLFPVYGGTGCEDIVRWFGPKEIRLFRRRRPIVCGFSDTTFLINWIWFRAGLSTFHFAGVDSAVFGEKQPSVFLRVLTGEINRLVSSAKNGHWLTAAPRHTLEGKAIGGNLTTFRDLLDVCDLRPPTWKPYILFIEDKDLDAEDFHRIIIALDQRGVFRGIRALVIGRTDHAGLSASMRAFTKIFGGRKPHAHHFIEYLLSDTIRERREADDPLAILEIDNFGHGVPYKDRLIIPIGGDTIIRPDASIEFKGPFVS